MKKGNLIILALSFGLGTAYAGGMNRTDESAAAQMQESTGIESTTPQEQVENTDGAIYDSLPQEQQATEQEAQALEPTYQEGVSAPADEPVIQEQQESINDSAIEDPAFQEGQDTFDEPSIQEQEETWDEPNLQESEDSFESESFDSETENYDY